MELSVTANDVPKEFQDLHDALYGQIKFLVSGGNFDIRKNTNVIRIVMQSAMEIVEKLRGKNGKTYSGVEKKQIVIRVTKWVIDDLAKDNIIPRDIADNVIAAIDLLGDVVIDMTVAAAKNLINVGQKIIEEVKTAAADDGVAGKSKCCGIGR